MTYEGLRLNVLKYKRKGLASYRRKRLNKSEFTIISNNCWGGMVYESYGLKKQSPTVGLFFMAKDYIRFVSNLEMYINCELKFISREQSKWSNEMETFNIPSYVPIGVLNDDVEIIFLHYHSEQEAYDKWKRRCARVNWDKLLIKFNDQNGCDEEDIKAFDALPFKNKICFTVKAYPELKSVVKIKVPSKHKFIPASYEPFGKNKSIDINAVINSL